MSSSNRKGREIDSALRQKGFFRDVDGQHIWYGCRQKITGLFFHFSFWSKESEVRSRMRHGIARVKWCGSTILTPDY